MPATKPHQFGNHPAFAEPIEDGRKTMTRRVIKDAQIVECRTGEPYRHNDVSALRFYNDPKWGWGLYALKFNVRIADLECPHAIGDIVTFEHTKGRYRITSIGAEALQDISAADAIREGVKFIGYAYSHPFGRSFPAIAAFTQMWNHLYPTGPKSWDANPPVFVYGFERVEDKQTNAAETRKEG